MSERATDASDIAHPRVRQSAQRAREDGQTGSDVRVVFDFA